MKLSPIQKRQLRRKCEIVANDRKWGETTDEHGHRLVDLLIWRETARAEGRKSCFDEWSHLLIRALKK